MGKEGLRFVRKLVEGKIQNLLISNPEGSWSYHSYERDQNERIVERKDLKCARNGVKTWGRGIVYDHGLHRIREQWFDPQKIIILSSVIKEIDSRTGEVCLEVKREYEDGIIKSIVKEDTISVHKELYLNGEFVIGFRTEKGQPTKILFEPLPSLRYSYY